MIRCTKIDEQISPSWRMVLTGLLAACLVSGCAQTNEPQRAGWASQGGLPPAEPRQEALAGASMVELQVAEALYQQGRNAEAQAAFMKLLDRYPRNAYFWFRLGNTYARARDPRNAISAFDNAVALDATDGRFYYNLALMHLIAAQESLELSASRLSSGQPLKAEAEVTLRQLSDMLAGGGRSPEPPALPASAPPTTLSPIDPPSPAAVP